MAVRLIRKTPYTVHVWKRAPRRRHNRYDRSYWAAGESVVNLPLGYGKLVFRSSWRKTVRFSEPSFGGRLAPLARSDNRHPTK